jgi:DNA-binding NarL/FixJ family response regulator
MIRLVLVDDQSLIRRGLRALLKTDPELEVVGEAENGKEAIDLVETLQPDLVLMDECRLWMGCKALGKFVNVSLKAKYWY